MTDAERKRRQRERERRHEIVVGYLAFSPAVIDLLLAIGQLKEHEIEDKAAVGRGILAMVNETAEAHLLSRRDP